MKMPPFKVLSPKSLDEALDMSKELSESGEDFDWIAGGTDLLPNYKWHINVKSHVISLSSIPELRELSEMHIGAMVSVAELAGGESTHPVLCVQTPTQLPLVYRTVELVSKIELSVI